ncbi:MAG: EF-hand domain-containing protein [Verrucomicrobiaceae bacterium]|nr:EF-hand domain-containing protein [Verrucomicrobiaceae bacterium]
MKRVLFALLLGSSTLTAALPGAESLAKLITKQFDTNSDDLIDAGEWQTGIAESFSKLDANNDGLIKPEESENLKEDIAEESGDIAATLIVALIQQVLSALDSDGDKAVSRKEYDELSLTIFGRLDADKNNSLTLAELSELPVKLITK